MKPQTFRNPIAADPTVEMFCACTSPVVSATAMVPSTSTPTDQSPAPAGLNIGGAAQTATLGSCCWSNGTDPGERVEACLDSVGIPTDPIALSAEEHLIASLSLPYEQPPIHLSFLVYEACDESPTGNPESILWSAGDGENLDLRPQVNQKSIWSWSQGYMFHPCMPTGKNWEMFPVNFLWKYNNRGLMPLNM